MICSLVSTTNDKKMEMLYERDEKRIRRFGLRSRTLHAEGQERCGLVVGSGWYSNRQSGVVKSKHWGGFLSRSPRFAPQWLKRVLSQSITPTKISILDACSPNPLPKEVTDHDKVEVTRQVRNFGHAHQCSSKNIECGWARGFLHGAMVAHVNSCDYVYVEQDCVLFGRNVFRKMFDEMSRTGKGMCYLADQGRHPDGSEKERLQQCLIAIKKDTLPFVISQLAMQVDHSRSEETKHLELFENVMTWAPFSGGRDAAGRGEEDYCRQHLEDEEMEQLLQ